MRNVGLIVMLLSTVTLAQGGELSYSIGYGNAISRLSAIMYFQNDTDDTVRLKPPRLKGLLHPITPELGQESEAGISLDRDTYPTLEIPPTKGGSRTTLPFAINSNAPVGLYRLELNLPGWRVDPNAQPLTVDPSLNIYPTYTTGQQFLLIDGSSKGFVRDGQFLNLLNFRNRIFTLIDQDADGAIFRVDGIPGKVRYATTDWYSAPLAPILEDASLDALKTRYLGRRVWQYGGVNRFECPFGSKEFLENGTGFGGINVFAGPPQSSLRVAGIYRLAASLELDLNGRGMGGRPWSPGTFSTIRPIAVVFDQPRNLRWNSAAYSGAPVRITPPNTPDCATFTNHFAGAWQLERLFSLTPPGERFLREVKNRKHNLGLTRWQYAWLRGFADASFGTRDELLRLNTWSYANIPFPGTITFKNGRVVDENWPRLP